MTVDAARADLAALADPARAVGMARFFKTGPGEYGEGDVFLGIANPDLRRLTRTHAALSPEACLDLLDDAEHEHRALALFVMGAAHARAARPRTRDDGARAALHAAYRLAAAAGRVNNWDLVDLSAEQLLGAHVLAGDAPAGLLGEYVADPDLWRRRIGLIAGFAFLKAGDAGPTLAGAETVLDDTRDLIHKASGWMLREAGKRVGRPVLLGFLDEHAAAMPRTMLSYATEHLDPELRAHYRAAR